MKYADLHVHTYYSDSTFSPEEVVKTADKKGLSAIAICDHDTIHGIEPSIKAASEFDIEIVPGIEMTVERVDTEIHILGYYIDWKASWFKEKLQEVQAARIKRIHKMVEKLRESNIEVDADSVFELAGQGTVGRLHMAQAILKTGKVKSFRDIFDKYIGYNKPCYVPYTKFSPEEAIQMIRRAGGVPTLAHPALMKNDNYIPELVSYGLRGIEVYHTDHDHKARTHYEEIAKAHDLIATGGSDCHGLGKGRILMGGVKVPYEVVERLKIEAKAIRHEHK